MNLKTIILVIIVSVLIGVAIFYGQKVFQSKGGQSNLSPNNLQQNSSKTEIYPSIKPYHAPSYPSVDQNTNLKNALENATAPDFSADYQNLEKEIDSL
jgi:hypothetical protein